MRSKKRVVEVYYNYFMYTYRTFALENPSALRCIERQVLIRFVKE